MKKHAALFTLILSASPVVASPAIIDFGSLYDGNTPANVSYNSITQISTSSAQQQLITTSGETSGVTFTYSSTAGMDSGGSNQCYNPSSSFYYTNGDDTALSLMASHLGLDVSAISPSLLADNVVKGGGYTATLAFTGLKANTSYNLSLVSGRKDISGVGSLPELTAVTGTFDSGSRLYSHVNNSSTNTESTPESISNGVKLSNTNNLFLLNFSATTDETGNLTLQYETKTDGYYALNALGIDLQVPEPATASLSLLGLSVLLLRRRRD